MPDGAFYLPGILASGKGKKLEGANRSAMSPLVGFATFVLAVFFGFLGCDMTANIFMGQIAVSQIRMVTTIGRTAEGQILNDLRNQIQSQAWSPTSGSPPTLAAYSAVPLCTSCGYTGTASYTVTGYTGGWTSPAGQTSVAASNLNDTLSERRMSVTIATSLTTGSTQLQQRPFRVTYALFATAPYALIVGENDALNSASSSGSPSLESNGSGCDPSQVAQGSASGGCGNTAADPSLANSALYSDTRVHVAPSCAPNMDSSECTSAGTSIPADSFDSSQSWTVPH